MKERKKVRMKERKTKEKEIKKGRMKERNSKKGLGGPGSSPDMTTATFSTFSTFSTPTWATRTHLIGSATASYELRKSITNIIS